MAVRSIIDIDLQGDDKFRRFAELFTKYQDQLAKSRPAWSQVRSEIQVSAQAFDRMSAALMAQTELTRRLSQEQKAAAQQTQAQSRSFRDIYRTTAGIAQHIKAATLDFLKWSGAVAAFSGLLGAGGLFGIERLAGTATSIRQQALGLGMTPGEVQAFNIDYGQFFNPQQAEQGIYNALHDITKRRELSGFGVSEQTLATNDPFKVMTELMKLLPEKTKNWSPETFINMMQAYGLDQIFSPEQIQAWGKVSPEERTRLMQQAQVDAGRLGMQDQTLRDWQQLHAQLQRVGAELDKVFIQGLVKLTGPLTNLSQAFINLVQAFMQSPTVAHWIDVIAQALNNFAKYISTPKFAADVQQFTAWVGTLVDDAAKAGASLFNFGEAVAQAVKWVTSILPKMSDHEIQDTMKGAALGGMAGSVFGPGAIPGAILGGGAGYLWGLLSNGPPVSSRALGLGNIPDATPNNGTIPGWVTGAPDIKNQSWMTGPGGGNLPITQAGFSTGSGGNFWKDLLFSVGMQESGGNPNARSSAGAEGLFQFMPETAARYGINPWDPQQAIQGASHYLSDLMTEFHGDIAEALAGYNWGEQNVEADIRQHGQNWMAYAPAETQNYVASILKRMMALQISQGSVNRITINNQTGANISYSSSQLVRA